MTVIRRVSYELSEAQVLLEQLRLAVSSDGASPRSFALLLKRVAEVKAWDPEFPSFRAYMTAPEPDGLGILNEQAFIHIAELGGVEKLARKLLYDDTSKATELKGRPVDKGSTTPITKVRDHTASSVVARLKRDDPVLAEKVIRGEITPNAAAREKGWRKPRVVVSTPEGVAKSLLKYMSADDIAKLIAALVGATDLSANSGRD